VTGGMSPTALGASVGALGGLGLWLVTLRLMARRPALDARLAPYLRSRAVAAGPSSARGPVATLERLLAPVMHDAVRLVERVGSPTAEVERRLVRAGGDRSVAQHRAEQVVWTVVATAGGLTVALALVAGRGTSTAAASLLVVACGVGGLAGRDQLLTAQVRRRERRLQAELPTVAELLALAVTAGEGALGALERVTRSTRGALADELGRVVAEVRSGAPVALALDRMADRTGVVAVSRFAEAVSVAVERGTPLADVLRAQAQDARETGRRALMETGGRKEVAMMIPVVFLVLPVTVLFAVFPGLLALRLEL
jgi:tight adherence protein C